MKSEYYDYSLLYNIGLCKIQLVGRRKDRPREYELINTYDLEEMQKACDDLDKRRFDDLRKMVEEYEKR